MNAYCLFCNTVKRDEVAEAVRQRLDVEVIVPKIIQRKWVKGKPLEDIHDYLPGYLFLYGEAPVFSFSSLFWLEDVYRVLGDADCGYRLSGSDLAFAQMLKDYGGTIGVLKTYKEGDRIKLAEGAMGGVNGEIVKIDRRGRALVRFGFDGNAIQSWVAIEMIDGSSQTVLPEA